MRIVSIPARLTLLGASLLGCAPASSTPPPEVAIPAPAYAALGHVVLREPKIEGSGLPPEVVRKHIHRVLAQVRYCHQREAKKDPTLAGDLTLELLVAAGGAVSSARVTDTTLPGERVIACVLSVMKRVAFPPLEGGGTLTVTPSFTFARFDPRAD